MTTQTLATATHPLLGQEILLRRGSRGRASGPGCERVVRAKLDEIDGQNVFATLLEDDPLATTAPFLAGEQGVWHGQSFIDGPAPAPKLQLRPGQAA